MHKLKHAAVALLILASLCLGAPMQQAAARPLGATAIGLGMADSFAVLGGAAVEDTNPSSIIGDVGLSPAAGTFYAPNAITPAEVTGTIYAVDVNGPAGVAGNNPALVNGAQSDLTTAYNNAAGQGPTTPLSGVDNQLGGQTLTTGVYSFGGASTANLIGTLTLDAEGDPNAVFIFKASSSLVTASASVVQITNGGQACNVFWQVGSSATLGTGTTFIGNILALTSITDDGNSNIAGRLLARNGQVTLNDTTVIRQTCLTTGGGGGDEDETGGGGGPGTQASRSQVSGLPNAGGAPIRNVDFPWSLMIVGGITAGALMLARRSSSRKSPSRR